MSISVRKLNADTTFLFTFSSETDQDSNLRVLVDPWLAGDSSWLHPAFQLSSHTVAPAISSLGELQHDIDLIIISQDKPDHCHKKTLCSWPKDRPIDIFTTPAAARKIKEWKHFDADRIHELAPYNVADQQSIKRILSPRGAGELSIANLATKKDLTGLHNAIAFTYQPCKILRSSIPPTDIALSTPPESPKLLRTPQDTLSTPTLRARIRSYSSLRSMARRPRTPIASPPHTPDDSRCMSCIYTPHGVSPSLIQPYLHYHLAASNALPLTLLVHSMVEERNPWFMGGIVAAGAPGGVELVRTLGGKVKHWVAAHDEEKDNSGVSVKMLKTQRYGMTEVQNLLAHGGYGDVKLAGLDSGEELRMLG
ncbi:hypothetical protein AMS68_006426 [Peltaster fructicola]|uniref:Metallo-beta-lactamase domain-containing protein n=1 Tax=Peltaster fructicola TaxID=286661 RepID=A0A6H0Y209_9PEZI|nr:hypothetical protein AMS68_006426 [Peltaster fructicola]